MMPQVVGLAFRVEGAWPSFRKDGRQEVMETIAAGVVRQDAWLAPGGWDGALWFGPWSWIGFVAYRDGIDVVDVGWGGVKAAKWPFCCRGSYSWAGEWRGLASGRRTRVPRPLL